MIIAYAGIGSFVTLRLGGPLLRQNAASLRTEANLRYSLVRLRENAESVAFYRGEAREAEEVRAGADGIPRRASGES